MTHVNGIAVMVFSVLMLQGCAESRKSIHIGMADPNHEMSEQFNNVFQDGDFYFAGLPTEAGIKSASERGVTVIVNLLPAEQQAGRVSFDEPALVNSLGMRYESIPMVPSTFSTDDIDRLAAIINDADGPMLIHCASSNRVGGIWAAYLHRHQGYTLDEALKVGTAAGLKPGGMTEAVRRVAGQ